MSERHWQPTGEQSRAAHPVSEGFIERDGVRVFYEVYGEGDPTILFVPPWAIVHSRIWKAQIPYLSRHYRVVVFDPRGNGRSDRPREVALYSEDEYARDALDVLDATGTEGAFIVTMSLGCQRSLILAAEHPDRVRGVLFMSPGGFSEAYERRARELPQHVVSEALDDGRVHAGFRYFNLPFLQREPDGFRRLVVDFMEHFFNEGHSTKQIEDAVGWGLETDARTLLAFSAAEKLTPERSRELAGKVRCPTLVLHGVVDVIAPLENAEGLARHLGTRVHVVDGVGHGAEVRKPVETNLLIRELVDPAFERAVKRRPATRRGLAQPRRALFISSPIGLGHVRRDVAIANELRALVPDLEVDWLAQHPVTKVLEAEGERIHPASAHLASESQHIECESAEHDLHCFQAIRRMDEILISNFMAFHDVARETEYDLWLGDEAWELDYYLHENPGEKRTPYVWLTDFVGWLPMPDGGEHEAFLTADYNEEMIGHIARWPEVRDRALFVGNAEDIVPARFGPELPEIRAWTEANFDFPGYVTGFDPAALNDRAALRRELGYGEGERVCIVSVGGSGVGEHLLRRVIESFPEARRRERALRMVVVAGPRIDPAALPRSEGLEVVPYVHDLYRHLAACDLAVVQGGLTTCMELAANRRPFLYFPLRHHFEQNHHVRYRLERYGAGRAMEYAESGPEAIAEAICSEIGREVDYRPVETDGARRAAERVAELL